jgi:hypothetical protein
VTRAATVGMEDRIALDTTITMPRALFKKLKKIAAETNVQAVLGPSGHGGATLGIRQPATSGLKPNNMATDILT